jgi:hypothetical protein
VNPDISHVTLLNHFSLSYNAQSFLVLQCSTIPSATILNHFFTELNYSVILVNSVIPRTTVLNHFSLSYSAQPFFATMNSIIFTTLLNYFMILSAILKIMSVICYNTQPFCKITQSFSRFHRSFSRMTYEGAGARARVRLDRGRTTLRMAHGLGAQN